MADIREMEREKTITATSVSARSPNNTAPPELTNEHVLSCLLNFFKRKV